MQHYQIFSEYLSTFRKYNKAAWFLISWDKFHNHWYMNKDFLTLIYWRFNHHKYEENKKQNSNSIMQRYKICHRIKLAKKTTPYGVFTGSQAFSCFWYSKEYIIHTCFTNHMNSCNRCGRRYFQIFIWSHITYCRKQFEISIFYLANII